MPSSAAAADDKEYTVEKILDYNKTEDKYLIKWKGYRKPTWEPASNLNPSAFEDALDVKERKRAEAAAKKKAAPKRSNNNKKNNKKRVLSSMTTGKTSKRSKVDKHKTCSAPGCTSKSRVGGVCIKHGATVKRCSHGQCPNNAVNGGLCVSHGPKVKLCSSVGCKNRARVGGVCMKHGATVKLCSREGCNNQSKEGGVCIRHGAKVKLWNSRRRKVDSMMNQDESGVGGDGNSNNEAYGEDDVGVVVSNTGHGTKEAGEEQSSPRMEVGGNPKRQSQRFNHRQRHEARRKGRRRKVDNTKNQDGSGVGEDCSDNNEASNEDNVNVVVTDRGNKSREAEKEQSSPRMEVGEHNENLDDDDYDGAEEDEEEEEVVEEKDGTTDMSVDQIGAPFVSREAKTDDIDARASSNPFSTTDTTAGDNAQSSLSPNKASTVHHSDDIQSPKHKLKRWKMVMSNRLKKNQDLAKKSETKVTTEAVLQSSLGEEMEGIVEEGEEKIVPSQEEKIKYASSVMARVCEMRCRKVATNTQLLEQETETKKKPEKKRRRAFEL